MSLYGWNFSWRRCVCMCRLHNGDNAEIKKYFVSFWNGVDLRYKLLKGPKVRISIAGIIISRVNNSKFQTQEIIVKCSLITIDYAIIKKKTNNNNNNNRDVMLRLISKRTASDAMPSTRLQPWRTWESTCSRRGVCPSMTSPLPLPSTFSSPFTFYLSLSLSFYATQFFSQLCIHQRSTVCNRLNYGRKRETRPIYHAPLKMHSTPVSLLNMSFNCNVTCLVVVCF